MNRKSNLKLIFLGTGTSMGIPVIGSDHAVCLSKDSKDKRLRTSVYIEYKDIKFIIDCGPDFRQQCLKAKIKELDFALLTHEHNDHVLGLDDLRPLIFKNQKPFKLFGLKRTLDEVKIRFPYAFEEKKYPGVPSFELVPIQENEDLKIDQNLTIESLGVLHGSLPILGFKINELVYITDASFISDEVISKIKGCKILILNSLNQEDFHYSHFVLSESLKIIKKIQPKKTYLTHISHKMGFHKEVSVILPKNIFLAYDNLKIKF